MDLAQPRRRGSDDPCPAAGQRGRHRRASPPVRGPRSRGSQLYLLQLLVVLVGLVLVVVGPWRVGIVAIGAAFVVGALARSVVPIDHTGMLRVRGKAFDIFWMATLGSALIVLAWVIPGQPG
ncbi:DUF3017 domain-containing protein [Aeromicrobium sp. SMF47]|nr:DUF3017 domain-containing protein [Aeromicrobium yanjiei]MRK00695.1 DUF3017 domain-containing protein [Aeromicrobium sp. S22]